MTTPSPPALAQPGSPYLLSFEAFSFEGGALIDPTAITLDVTFGGYVQLVPDAPGGGPFTYTGANATLAGPGVLWRTGIGQYSFQWQVPGTAMPGVYTANWTWTYGPNNDTFLATENFAVKQITPSFPQPPGRAGFWTGSISYQPAWASTPFVIPLGETDSNGVAWLLENVTGWDGPPTVGQVIQRSADHGGWPSAAFYGPRLLTVTILATAPDQATRDLAKQQLVQAIPVSDLATFTWNEPVPKQVYVRQNGAANIQVTTPSLIDAEFTIPLVAPDPRKYSTVQLTQTATLPAPVINPLTLPVTLPAGFPGSVPPIASAVTCTNSGTFETRPVITVTGPIGDPSIVNAATGQAITFTGLNMAASDQLVISTDARQAYLNSVFAPADVTSAWWVMTPGDTAIFLTGDNYSGGATVTVSWASAWALCGIREPELLPDRLHDDLAHAPALIERGPAQSLMDVAREPDRHLLKGLRVSCWRDHVVARAFGDNCERFGGQRPGPVSAPHGGCLDHFRPPCLVGGVLLPADLGLVADADVQQ